MRLTVGAVLFDLDGVLIDSTTVVERHWRMFCETHGFATDDVLPFVHGRRTVDNIRSLAPHVDTDAEVIAFEKLEVEDVEGLSVLPGALEVVEALARARWAVVTSGSRAVAGARLRAAGLPIPSVVVAAEDVLKGKPEPDGYVAAASSLNVVPGDCLVVEDTNAGVSAGKAAGAQTLALLTTQAPAELADADFIVANLRSCAVISASPAGSICLEVSETREPA